MNLWQIMALWIVGIIKAKKRQLFDKFQITRTIANSKGKFKLWNKPRRIATSITKLVFSHSIIFIISYKNIVGQLCVLDESEGAQCEAPGPWCVWFADSQERTSAMTEKHRTSGPRKHIAQTPPGFTAAQLFHFVFFFSFTRTLMHTHTNSLRRRGALLK